MFTDAGVYQNKVAYRQIDLSGRYFVDYVPGNEILVITFYPVGFVNERAMREAEPWGLRFLSRYGTSILGVKPAKADWYRGAGLHRFFRSDEFADFAKGFDRVILYGGSMGAFAALVFSQAVANAEVIALSPQSTLDPALVPWDQRFPDAASLDWTGDFADAAALRHVQKLHIAFDPLDPCDRRHAARIPSENRIDILLPFLGHASPVWLTKLGLLQDLVGQILARTFDQAAFRQLLKRRRELAQYFIEMSRRAGTRRPDLRRIALEKAETLAATDMSALPSIAQMHVDEGRPDQAEAVLHRFIEMKPDLPQGHYQLARLLKQQGRFDEAASFGERALSLNPKNRFYQEWLVDLASARGR